MGAPHQPKESISACFGLVNPEADAGMDGRLRSIAMLVRGNFPNSLQKSAGVDS